MRARARRRVSAVGWTAAVVVALVPTVLSVGDSSMRLGSLAAQLVLAASAILLWPNPEHQRHARLLLAASVAIGVSNLDSASFEFGYWIEVGVLFQWVPVALLLPVLLEHPSPAGTRSAERRVRWLIALTWLWAVGLTLVLTLTWDPAFVAYDGAAEWFTVYPSLELSRGARAVAVSLLVVLASWFVALSVGRWRTARGPQRTTVRVVAAAGVLLAVGLVLRNLSPYAARAGLLSDAQVSALDLAHNVFLAAAPLALLAVAISSAARRAAILERLLTAAGDAQAVEDVLRQELGDPTLELTFVASGDVPPRDAGVGTDPSARGRVRRVLPAGDGAWAVVDLDATVLLDPVGLRQVLAATSVVLANTRLASERVLHLAELEASRSRIVEAGEQGRRRLERDLHDGAQQHLLTVSTSISRARLASAPAQVSAALDDAREQLSRAMQELRRLARGIHPAELSQGGLGLALEGLAARVDNMDLELGPGLRDGKRLPAAAESTAYFVISEAVTNARKHACGAVHVHVDHDGETLRATVSDDGPGGAVVGGAGGLRGLVDRVAALGGSLDVVSPAGRGTVVRLELPVAVRSRDG